MRELIKHILKETILLNETGIRGIRELAKRYPKAKIYFHQDLDGVTTAIGMKNYLEQHGIEVVDAEVIQYGDKEWAIKKPEGNGEIMPVLVDFAHGKPMFEQSTSFRSARSNVETISQTISPKEIFPAEDITLISTVDSANFTQYDISVDDVLSFLFKIDREADLKRNKMLMGLVVNKLLLAFKNKPGFLEELVLECKPSLLNILLKIKSIMKREGFDKEDILTQNQKDYIQSMNKSENVTLSDNILVQYGGGYMIPQGSYDRYTPFKNNPNADFLVIAWPVGLVQASCNPYKKDRALKGVNLGEIKDEVLEHFKSELSNQKVTFGDLKRNSEFKAKYNSVGFTFKDMMAIYGDSPSLKIEGGNKLKEILSDISDRLYKNLSPKQKQLLERVYVNGFDVIKANSGGHKCITNISGINYLYRNKKDPRLDNISNELMPIANYTGDNKFLNDIKEKLLKYGRLSERQIEVALNQLEKEKGNLDIEESNTKSYVDLVKEIQSYFVELLKDKIEKSERDSDNKKELDEYSRTLKMTRRQGSGTRFPKSAVKASPNRFRKYSRLKESDIEKLDLDDLANKKEKLKKIIVKIIDKIITKATYNKDETKIFFFNKDDEFLLNYDIKGEKLWYDHELYENYIIGRIKVNFYLGTTFKEALQEWFNDKFKKEGYEVIDKWWSYEHNPNVEGANMTLY